MTTVDLIIVGAGPAGVSGALEAARLGLSVLVLDENPSPGGRIWQALETRFDIAADGTAPPGSGDRNTESSPAGVATPLSTDEKKPDSPREPAVRSTQSDSPAQAPAAPDPDDLAALALLREFRACTAAARYRAAVWAIEPDGTVFWTQDGATCSARGHRILLATGTTERPFPIPGWTLPGVMTVGAAQIALKTGGLVPDDNSWIAGQGPLLLLYAAQVLRAGGRIGGVLDLSDGFAPFRALRHLPGAWSEIGKGLAWRREIAQAGVRWLSASDLRAEGDGVLRRIAFRAGGRSCVEPADLLLLHDGVIPSVQITRALGCAHEWDPALRCWKPVVDAWGNTSIGNVLVAGDGAGIGGARAAACTGRIAAIGVAHVLGRIDTAARDRAAARWRAERDRHLVTRRFLDALFAPRAVALADADTVCRCEEVTAGQIRDAVRTGCLGLNQLKAFTRLGMGACQGRQCGSTAAETIAQARGVPTAEIEPLRTRFPVKPLSVGELAGLTDAHRAMDPPAEDRSVAVARTADAGGVAFLPRQQRE
jgi:NADPH-dependent 2,4-dienoyl-CoA reductase/sulfur reductase-like enzyme